MRMLKRCRLRPIFLAFFLLLLGLWLTHKLFPDISLDYVEVDNRWKEWSINPRSVKIQGLYEYVKFTVKPFAGNNEDAKKDLVCLATQTSLNGIRHVVETSDNWRGQMVVSLYVPGLEFTRAKVLLWMLYRCSLLSSSKITIYFAWPLSTPAIDHPWLWTYLWFKNCDDPYALLEALGVEKQLLMYPQNSMRNIARRACKSEYVIVTDVDMIPTRGLANALQPVLQQQRSCEKCAFVVPGYEISKNVSELPDTKNELRQLVEANLSRPFHWVKWRVNQEAHDPKRWEKIEENDRVQIAYPVNTYIYKYEPIYIVKKTAPDFDDRFIGFGFNRNSQIIQIILEGYRFYLLDNAFLRHRGMARRESMPIERMLETVNNREIFFNFTIELLRQHHMDDEAEKIMMSSERNKKEEKLKSFIENIYNNRTFHDAIVPK